MLELEDLPTVVDTLDDAASRAYDAWPDRLYLVARDGRVRYQGAPGPEGFDPDGLEQAIRAELAGEPLVVAEAPPPRERVAPLAVESDDHLWACGPSVLDERDADDYHSRLNRWWKRADEHFVAYSTCSRATTDVALAWMETTVPDLVRFFGVRPALPATVILLRSLVQYNAFAITAPDGEHVPPESTGWSAFHHAFPCESWVDVRARNHVPGAAAAYWDDRTDAGNAWGPFAVRHAAAQAFVEQLDPSPVAAGRLRTDPLAPFDSDAFWAEKRFPLWMRYGSALYVERFFVDHAADDPNWARAWSLGELEAMGGLEPLDDALRCALEMTAVERSRRRILQAGLLVAFVLDGGDALVTERHAAFRRAVGEGGDVRAAVAALEAAIREREDALRRFARSGSVAGGE